MEPGPGGAGRDPRQGYLYGAGSAMQMPLQQRSDGAAPGGVLKRSLGEIERWQNQRQVAMQQALYILAKFSSLSVQVCVDRKITLENKRKGSPCQQEYQHDDSSQSGQAKGCSGPDLPEDIWRHIHSLMPLRDAARAACVSRAFLCSWRCYPHLDFRRETFGLNGTVFQTDKTARAAFTSKVDHILKKHSGVGVKTLKLLSAPAYNAKDFCYLNSWLQMAVTPGLEELTLCVSSENKKYTFPYSLLSHGNGDLIRSLLLTRCTFRPTVELGCFRSLMRLYLCLVRITGDALGCLLSNSFALEQLQLRHCNKISCLKIPCFLLRLSYLEVLTCSNLQVIESKAPNISSFVFDGRFQVQLSLGEASQVKNLEVGCSGAVYYTRAELVSSMANLESLTIRSSSEVVNTPMVSSKFLYLKYLRIALTGMTFSPSYDYFSLVSFLDASPNLETLFLNVWQAQMKHVSVLEDPSELRQMPAVHNHDKLRTVTIYAFSSAKSLVELTCHILGTATSLEWLILETRVGHANLDCSVKKVAKCSPMLRDNILEAHRALWAIERYIKPKVPCSVNLNVVEPCSRCHVVEPCSRCHAVGF